MIYDDEEEEEERIEAEAAKMQVTLGCEDTSTVPMQREARLVENQADDDFHHQYQDDNPGNLNIYMKQ